MNIRALRPALFPALALALVSMGASNAAPRRAAKPSARPTSAKASAPRPAAYASLPIAMPPGAKVEFEVDGGEADVLGMVKSFARGLEEANATSKSQSSRGVLAQVLGDKQLSAILKDVRHLHLVVYRLDEPEDVTFGAPTPGGTMEGGVKLPAAQPNFDAIAFHSKPLLAAGGRRNLLANMGRTKIQMFDFAPSGAAATRGFGLIAQGPTRIIVARSLGYPDVAVLGRLIKLNGGG